MREALSVSVWRILPYVIPALAAVAVVGDVDEPDVYWHIRMGDDILQNRRFTGDPYWVYGPGDSNWVTTQWLSEVFFSLVHSFGGWIGIAGLKILFTLAFFASLFFVISKILPKGFSKDEVARTQTIIGILVLPIMPSLMQERPQSISFIILPLLGLWATRLLYAGRWPRWWIVGLVTLVWSWFHGAALLVAPVLFAAFLIHLFVLRPAGFVRNFLRNGLPVIAVAMLAPAVSPVGWNYYRQAFLIREVATESIAEWQPPSLLSITTIAWLTLLIVWSLSALVFARSKNRAFAPLVLALEWTWLLLLLAFSAMATRYVFVAVILAIPVIARRLTQALHRRRIKTTVPAAWAFPVTAFIALAVSIFVIPAWFAASPTPPEDPNRIWEGLASTSDERRVFVEYNISGKTLMLTSPSTRVSIDGRSDRYGQYLSDYVDILEGRPGSEVIFDERYGESTDVLVKSASPLNETLQRRGWNRICEDNGYVWLTRPGFTGACAE